MGFCSYKMFVLLLCLVGCIARQPLKASAIRNVDIALHRNELWSNAEKINPRKLIQSMNKMENINAKSEQESTVKNDPNQSEKRRVHRGSDPIHNRC